MQERYGERFTLGACELVLCGTAYYYPAVSIYYAAGRLNFSLNSCLPRMEEEDLRVVFEDGMKGVRGLLS